LTNRPDEIYVDLAPETEDITTKETDRFEEFLADSVYECLSSVSRLLAPALDACLQGATTVEVGLRKSRMKIRDCESFETGLERVFGSGAKVIEYRILKILYSKLEISKQVEQSLRFSDEVKTAKRLYESKLRASSIK
jgi:hypothetical protein